MSSSSRTDTRLKIALAFLLNWVAGFVDAVCYLALFRVFVANMTGDTVASAIGFAQGQWDLVIRRGLAVPLFVVGLIAGRLAVEWRVRRGYGSVVLTSYLSEAILLAIFILVTSPHLVAGELPQSAGMSSHLLLALPACAMGIQNSTLSHFGPLNVKTTHVTGTLTEAAKHFVRFVLRVHDRKIAARWRDDLDFRMCLLFSWCWAVYLLGGYFGVVLRARWDLGALWLPVVFLLALAAFDSIHSFEKGDEPD
jgi:uncharacterized membrane protein YoaK (UPF0700 family)